MSQARLLTLDVVVLLPPHMRANAVESSCLLAERLESAGHTAAFRLGERFPGETADRGVCEPHVSLFMLAVAADEAALVVDAVRALARSLPAIVAVGEEYRYNPYGAPELHFTRSVDWVAVQRRVLDAVEPLRRGRLRAVGPGGEPLPDLVAGRLPAQPAVVRQLTRYGYDEITDDEDDRFHPHVTLCWPRDPAARAGLGALPDPARYSGALSTLAVYGMSPYGTCTVEFGTATLSGDAVSGDEDAAFAR